MGNFWYSFPMQPSFDGKEIDFRSIDWTRTTAQERLSYGGLVRDLRMAKGLRQEELSEMSGVSRKTIGNIEAQKTAGQPLILENLFRHLGASGGAKLAGEDQQYLAIIGPLIAALPRDTKEEVMRRVLQILVNGISGQSPDSEEAPSKIKRIGRMMG